ncbi:MAG: sugar transferase [Armatimonadetes bacterium]|nr:sugar transferase [Armatimonadota bacterium]
MPRRRWALAVKRAADVVLAAIGLLLTGPLILALAWLVKRDDPGPAFFVQERLGKDGRIFKMYKLRTMVVGAEQMGAGLGIEHEDPRITPVGRWLRALSLDELPQLWNILRGDMSFVGPRPLPVRYLERWNAQQRLRLLMPQGITGWAQVRGRNELSWPVRFEMDVWYVKNWSLWLDLRIFASTIWAVLKREGISGADGRVPEFMGEEQKAGE